MEVMGPNHVQRDNNTAEKEKNLNPKILLKNSHFGKFCLALDFAINIVAQLVFN